MLTGYLARGEFNVICDRCGKKKKSGQVTKEWTGLIVCHKCLDYRHPQDFVRGVRDNMSIPFSRPVPEATYNYTYSTSGNILFSLSSGPEDGFDLTNTITVTLTSGTLSSVTEADILSGANMAAIAHGDGTWEILQFQNATLLSGTTYYLTKLLRARVGTELAMGASAGAKFFFVGQSSPSTYMGLVPNFGIGNKPFSPVDVTSYMDRDDIVVNWTRRSKVVRLDQDNTDPVTGGPLGELEEKYAINILDSDGEIVRTIYIVAATTARYSYADQLADFGTIPTSYDIEVYQISPEWGDGSARAAALPVKAWYIATASSGSYQAAATRVVISTVHTMLCHGGAYTVSGKLTSYSFVTAPFRKGSFVATGKTATFSSIRQLHAGRGSFVHHGGANQIITRGLLPTARGVFTVSGKAVGLLKHKTTTLSGGAFTMHGGAISYHSGKSIAISKGAVTNTGKSTAIKAAHRMAVSHGGVVATGAVARFSAGTIIAGKSAFTLTGRSIAIRISRRLAANKATFTNAGKVVGYLYSNGIVQEFLTTTGAGTWTVPSTWNNANNKIECVGGGGGGGFGGGSGGGGGAYSAIVNQTLSIGANLSVSVGAGGLGETHDAAGTDGGNTWFYGTSLASCVCGAQGGEASSGWPGTTGGAAARGTGSTKYSGGNGGEQDTGYGGGGGGGAAGPSGNGKAGGVNVSSSGGDENGGSGGGGANGGSSSAGASNSSTTLAGGAGGNGTGGSGAGAAGTAGGGNGGDGSSGGGGGGGGGSASGAGGHGGAGGSDTAFNASHGSGGGGGGGGATGGSGTSGHGGAGGLYGGGGGGGEGWNDADGGNGAQGIIVITHNPVH